jgi:hypothetical protein
MEPKWFIIHTGVPDAQPGFNCVTTFGPYASDEAAVAGAKAIVIPGEYIVYGPAPAAHRVIIGTPVVNATAI